MPTDYTARFESLKEGILAFQEINKALETLVRLKQEAEILTQAQEQEHTQERTVDMLRIGRVALLYLSLDGNEAGQWNRTTKEWQVLPNTYRRSIARGLQIAKKQAAPQLITIPIPAPQKIAIPAKHDQLGEQAERQAQERHNEGGQSSEVEP